MLAIIAAVAVTFWFFVGAVVGVLCCDSAWDEWAIKNRYAYRDPATGKYHYEPDEVKAFWERHDSPRSNA